MRLGLTPLSPRMGAQTSAARRSPLSPLPSSRASAFSPIDVDGDSTDDAEPSSNNRPSLSTPSAPTTHYESSDESEHKQSEHKDDAERSSSSVEGGEKREKGTEKKQLLNFFFQYEDRTPKKRRRDAQHSGSSAQSSPAKDELHEVICAPRTNICGEKYDRSDIEFLDDRVELTIWRADIRKWQGEIQYAHLGRFWCVVKHHECLSRSMYLIVCFDAVSREWIDRRTFYCWSWMERRVGRRLQISMTRYSQGFVPRGTIKNS